ncbi:hypothetical protein [Micropruina sonneratiae]|uniref:hypothetical protein n=1 Tax=Micropruina sonneratiae TaxID=2986940 RepID=UPI0022274906|nr:hypothetical protein [Micropruina sp. KQZ13P-5]MCW3156993.1 hypothetical protein [Micropruina sp. KQZ13P-5]
MEVLKHLFVLFHLLGFAAIFAGTATQLAASTPRVNRFIMDGGWTQLLTGLVLVGLNEMGPDPVNHAKVAVKLVVLLVIVVVAFVNRKKPAIGKGVLFGLFGLTLLNAAVAVLWA